MRRLALVVPLALIAHCGSLVQADAASPPYEAADLEGAYSIRLGPTADSADRFLLEFRGVSLVGLLEFDGAGGVSGTRRFHRPVSVATGGAIGQTFEVIDQDLTGSYTLGADGRGAMQLQVAPTPPWLLDYGALSEHDMSGVETVDFVLADGGCSIELLVTLEGELDVIGNPAAQDIEDDMLLVGTATRQDEACRPPDVGDRLEILQETVELLVGELEGLRRQQCETIRLLLTPEGRRASDCCGETLAFPAGKDRPSCGGEASPEPTPRGPRGRG